MLIVIKLNALIIGSLPKRDGNRDGIGFVYGNSHNKTNSLPTRASLLHTASTSLSSSTLSGWLSCCWWIQKQKPSKIPFRLINSQRRALPLRS